MTNAEALGKLVLDRTAEDDIKMRDMYVRVDDLPEETLLYGKSLEFGLAPGEHRLKVTNRIKHAQVALTIGPGESVRFEAANVYAPGLMSALAAVLGTVMYKPVLRRR